jgi:alkanesulfonate monooxygenase SsuD/methylene tetrahydromethanopterin reductase-like flavin-dependent oxidoreductase (luciferase family)
MPTAPGDPVASPRAPAIGVLLPQEEGPGDPEPSWRLISAAARRAEEAGLDSAWLVDHLV